MRKETNEPMNEIPHGDIHANFFPQLTPHWTIDASLVSTMRIESREIDCNLFERLDFFHVPFEITL